VALGFGLRRVVAAGDLCTGVGEPTGATDRFHNLLTAM